MVVQKNGSHASTLTSVQLVGKLTEEPDFLHTTANRRLRPVLLHSEYGTNASRLEIDQHKLLVMLDAR